ncbi:uncharacterized protein LOC124587293 [Schistocerca americana]|uniref:uncharacterized protein LOC124587293 n=1 Tax=Schistocerca americana TaxID=7009 RepID=UPI001F503FAC|nr:uncharacterized protein LOC124587293 [Schistocerca americana]
MLLVLTSGSPILVLERVYVVKCYRVVVFTVKVLFTELSTVIGALEFDKRKIFTLVRVINKYIIGQSGKLVKVHSSCTCQFRSNVSSHQTATVPAVDMSRRKVTTYGRVAYQRLPGNDTVDFIDAQFEKPAAQIPWKSIVLASVLCFGGTILLLVGSLLVTGHIEAKYADRTWPLLILGSIMFLPGAYHIRIAYCAFRRYPGYSFDDIPEFD